MSAYVEKFSQIDTLEGLFNFRNELQADGIKNEDWNKGDGLNKKMLSDCQEANYFRELVEKRISHLMSAGMSLDKILTKEEAEKTPAPAS